MALPPLLSHPTPAQTRSSGAMTSSVYYDHLSNCSGNMQLLTSRKFSGNLGSRSVHVSSARRRSGIIASSQPQNNRAVTTGDGYKKSQVSTTGVGRQTSTTVAAPPPFPPPQNQFGSPLLWIGVGVGISIAFSWVAKKAQSYAMQQALKTMMQQTGQGGSPFSGGPGNNPFAAQNPNLFSGQNPNPFAGMPPGSFPFPPPTGSASPASSAASATIDVPSVETSSPQAEVQVNEKPIETKKPAFTDVDPSILTKEESKFQEQQTEPNQQPKTSFSDAEVVGNTGNFAGANNFGSQANTSENGKSFISIEMLETMLDDPKIQKMVFPYLPEEMRDPVTFKRMIQFPPVRQQLQEALNNMGGEDGMDMLKYMNSDVVKQQFEQIGLTPEEVVGKILASPDIATSLQNPKVVEAIMDCSQNPLNITKYQNDPEVMNALMKIAELFPGASGSS